jgi:NADP-dependent 3-hydroxy acid dehydrogenase YdfG
MKISITGHTSGLGLALANYYSNAGHTVLGFSRSNGYDITAPTQILEESKDCDLFINNAYHGMAQVHVLYSLHEMWKHDNSKTIFTVGSVSADGIKTWRHPYAVYKNALDRTVEQLQNCPDTQCRILHLKPGYIDTPMVANVTHKKMSTEYVAEVVVWMISQTNGDIKTLTVTPSKKE